MIGNGCRKSSRYNRRGMIHNRTSETLLMRGLQPKLSASPDHGG